MFDLSVSLMSATGDEVGGRVLVNIDIVRVKWCNWLCKLL